LDGYLEQLCKPCDSEAANREWESMDAELEMGNSGSHFSWASVEKIWAGAGWSEFFDLLNGDLQ
jgi:hypothetical protein